MNKFITIGFIVCMQFLSFSIFGQNFGLTQKQDPATLPHSKAAMQKPVRKSKIPPQTLLQPTTDGAYILTGGWEMTDANEMVPSEQSIFNPKLNTSQWYNATVPGTVLTTLVEQGVYPDPYWGLNNLSIPDSLCRMDWWYRISFEKPGNTTGKKAWLIFNGINYKADIWLNGKLLGQIKGAFARGEFDVTDIINSKNENILAVHIFPPRNPGIPHEESPTAGTGPNGGQLCMDGPTFISSEGWDWIPGIRDRNIGIWQDVQLQFTGNIKITDPQIITDLPLPDTTQADITIKTILQNISFKKQTVTLKGQIENIEFEQMIALQPGEQKQIILDKDLVPVLHMINPRLWWPNGYGKPELYKLVLTVINESKAVSDQKTIRFGVRELSYELTVDAPTRQGLRVEFNPIAALKDGKAIFDNVNRRETGEGTCVPKLRKDISPGLLPEISSQEMAPYLVIKVNGQRIFCKGGNWGMDNGMKNSTRQHLEPYMRLHRDAHFNMVRNWTGESTEEIFYDLCDEYGMLVWNDFWLSTQGYNLNVNDNQLFIDNARDVVHRFRNHPSIAIWCPRNEGYAPQPIEEALADLLVSDDGTRYYQANSRNLNLKPSGPWNYFKEPVDYFRYNAKGFNTEQGTPSVPTAASMRKMMAEEDVWPISDVWYYHDLHEGQKDYLNAIENKYGKSETLEDFCKKAQLVNYDSHRAMFESWNSKLWNSTSGLLLWMTHPAWPSTVWQVYSWDYETFGSYFASAKACEPVHIQMNLDNNKVVAINTSLKVIPEIKAKLLIFSLQGKKLYQKEQLITLSANQLTDCFMPELPGDLPDIYLARLTLTNKAGIVLSQNEYWKTATKEANFQNFNQLPQIQLTGKLLRKMPGAKNSMTFQLINNTKSPAIGIKLNLRNSVNNEIILPAYFTDGYFTLLPGESRQISVEFNLDSPITLKITAEGYNVKESPL